MTKTIKCPNCKTISELPIDKCPDCGYVFKFQTLQPVIPVEVVKPIEAVVPLDYNPNEVELEKTCSIPTVAIFEEKEVEPPAPKERKRIKQQVDYELINHEKRLSFALIFVMASYALVLLHSTLPLFTLIYELIYNAEVSYVLYDVLYLLNDFFVLLLLGYYLLIGILSTSKKRNSRLAAFSLTVVSAIMHFGFMLALQFVTYSAGVQNYIILIVLIIWSIAQKALLDIKREG